MEKIIRDRLNTEVGTDDSETMQDIDPGLKANLGNLDLIKPEIEEERGLIKRIISKIFPAMNSKKDDLFKGDTSESFRKLSS